MRGSLYQGHRFDSVPCSIDFVEWYSARYKSSTPISSNGAVVGFVRAPTQGESITFITTAEAFEAGWNAEEARLGRSKK